MGREVELLNPCELTLSITVLANSIACKLSDEELELVAAAISQLGETLGTIAVQRVLCKHRKEAAACEDTEKESDHPIPT